MTLLITGSYPPDVCGVGDYTSCLMNSTSAKDWKLFYKKDWNIKNYKKYKKEIDDLTPDKIIIQYPTLGYKWSFIPFLILAHYTRKLGKKCIMVYHEFSNKKLKARIVQDFALFFAKKLVVTNEYEKAAVRKHHKKLDISIIKIFSNISAVDNVKAFSERKYDFINFGQICPGKGIEEYIDLISSIKGKNNALIGRIPSGLEDYGREIIEKAKDNNINVFLDLNNEDTSAILNNSKCAILPFPDGISERRGSFLASAVNGCLIVSTKGKYTTEGLRNILFEELPASSENILNKITTVKDDYWKSYYDKVLKYLNTEMPKSWDEIVEKYNEI